MKMYDAYMRTTLTIDEEIAERIRNEVELGKRSLKAVVNDALRRGMGLEPVKRTKPYRVKAHSSAFAPGVDPGRLNQLVDELESAEFLAKQQRGA
jgi:hypothetical protein